MPSELKPGALTALASPREDDSVLVLDVKRRLASDALAAGDQGAWSEAIEVLRALAHGAESEKVRAQAAKDLLRFGVSIAYAPDAKRKASGPEVALTAAALLASVDPARLRETAEAVRAMRGAVPGRSAGDARVVEVPAEVQSSIANPVPEEGGDGGSDRGGRPAGRGTPSDSVTGLQDRPGADPVLRDAPDVVTPPPPAEPPPPLTPADAGLPEFAPGLVGHGRSNPRTGEGVCPW